VGGQFITAITKATDESAEARRRLVKLQQKHPVVGQVERLARESYLQTMHTIGGYSGLELPRYSPQQMVALKLAAMQLSVHLLRPPEEVLAAWQEAVGPGHVADALRWVDAPVNDLPCGLGKSESGKGLVVASLVLHARGELGSGRYPGVLFVLDSTDELDATYYSLLTALAAHGIDGTPLVGVFHGLKDRELKPLADRERCADYPVLLMCSQQLQARAKEARKIPFAVGAAPFLEMADGGQRQLVIKDETLHTTAAYIFDVAAIEQTAFALCRRPIEQVSNMLKGNEDIQQFLLELEAGLVAAAQELGAADGAVITRCKMPPMDECMARRMTLLAKKISTQSRGYAHLLDTLSEIASVVDLEVAIHRRGQESMVMCKTVPCWPEEISSVVTLDANWSADLLSQSSSRYQRSRLLGLMRISASDLKDMSRLKLHLAVGECGREAMLNAVKRRKIGKGIVNEVIRIHSTSRERCLIFVFLPDWNGSQKVNYAQWIKEWLVRAGVPADEICMDRDALRPTHRVAIETWGRHKTTNAYVDFGNVLFLGILQQPAVGLAMHSWSEGGEPDGGTKAMPWNEVELRRSQMVCDFVQALLRGCARRVEYGKCLPMNVYAQVWDPGQSPVAFDQECRKLLGNYLLLNWDGVGEPFIRGPDAKRHRDLEDVVVQLLAKAKPGEDGTQAISFVAVKAEWLRRTGKKIGRDTWQRRRVEVSEELEKHGIFVRERSWVKPVA